jgi:hypothetical protein
MAPTCSISERYGWSFGVMNPCCHHGTRPALKARRRQRTAPSGVMSWLPS